MSAEAIAALRAKGAELAAERDWLLRRADALAADIASLNRAIAILDPAQAGSAAAAPVRKRRKGASSLDGLYGKGEFQRDALAAIRTAAGPVTAHGVARDLAERKGIDLGSYATRRGFEKRVSALLSGLKTRGVLVNGTADAEGRQTYTAAS
ncbi:hypothetical protein [Belnapia rosea]|uniref:hypothetical protein n=1 Tax=Belnapia rosea TaxID=938405 RepID=UPI000891BF09|nr:hypothetical protein [Belnapia rosea]SDB22319.1 hypothetical protein SAMN02927895_00890 [Belnapia rosea]